MVVKLRNDHDSIKCKVNGSSNKKRIRPPSSNTEENDNICRDIMNIKQKYKNDTKINWCGAKSARHR